MNKAVILTTWSCLQYIDDSYDDSDEPSLDIDERVGIVEETDCPSNKTVSIVYTDNALLVR